MGFEGFTMSPPYGGLDLVSPIDNMDPASALELVNVLPGAGAPTVRLGYAQLSTTGASISGEIQFMHRLPLADGTTELIVATSNKLYSVSSVGVVTDITKATPHTSGEFTWAILENNIYLTNASGADYPQVYGTVTGGTAKNVTYTGAGLSFPNLVTCSSYKRRIFFVEKGTGKVWYSNVDQGGTSGSPALKKEDLGYNLTQGGFLLWTGSFTNQTASTSAEYFYAISSEGEIIMYAGDGPDDANWTQVARFYIGKPLGYRSYVRVNQDTWILTQQGIVPLSALFTIDPEQALNVVGQKINPMITDYAVNTPFDHAWYGFLWAGGRRVYINVPTNGNSSFFLVYSLDTKAWTTFQLASGTDAAASTIFNNLPYYGSASGIIWKGETGYADQVTTSSTGSPIIFAGRTAFSFYGSRGNYKAFKDIRPILKTQRGLSLTLGLDTDFKRRTTVETITTPPGTFTTWGSTGGVPTFTPWGSPWSSEAEYIFNRYAVKGQGHCAAIRFAGSIKNTTCQILGFEIRFDMGGQV
jgi:hypothetical protein